MSEGDQVAGGGLSRRDEFVLREYDAIQAKIDHAVRDLARTETIVPVAMAALYAWLVKDGGTLARQAPWIYFIPVGLALIGLLRQEARYAYIRVAETYLRKVEVEIYGQGAEPIEGWENFYQNKSVRNHHVLRVIIWIALLAVSFTYACAKLYYTGR
jgi:hypothetical protein